MPGGSCAPFAHPVASNSLTPLTAPTGQAWNYLLRVTHKRLWQSWDFSPSLLGPMPVLVLASCLLSKGEDSGQRLSCNPTTHTHDLSRGYLPIQDASAEINISLKTFWAWHSPPSLQISAKSCCTCRWKPLSLEKHQFTLCPSCFPWHRSFEGNQTPSTSPSDMRNCALRQNLELLSPGFSIPASRAGAKLPKKHMKPWTCPRFAASRKPLQFQISLTNQLWGKQLVWLKIDIINTNQEYNIYQLVHEFKSSFKRHKSQGIFPLSQKEIDKVFCL